MNCAKCGQFVAEGQTHCPHCVSRRTISDREVVNGGLKGGAIGLALGLLLVTLLLAGYDLERGIKAVVTVVPLGLFITGFIVGLVRARRTWK